MANHDLQQRKVEVNRLTLLETLKSNRVKHVAEYEEAMTGYKESLLAKLDEGIGKARAKLESSYQKARDEVGNLTDDDIKGRSDYVRIVDQIVIEMKVPHSYADAYDAAIDIVTWDVRETLELTHAEFTCFVRDQWDWKLEFQSTTAMYNNPKKF